MKNNLLICHRFPLKNNRFIYAFGEGQEDAVRLDVSAAIKNIEKGAGNKDRIDTLLAASSASEVAETLRKELDSMADPLLKSMDEWILELKNSDGSLSVRPDVGGKLNSLVDGGTETQQNYLKQADALLVLREELTKCVEDHKNALAEAELQTRKDEIEYASGLYISSIVAQSQIPGFVEQFEAAEQKIKDGSASLEDMLALETARDNLSICTETASANFQELNKLPIYPQFSKIFQNPDLSLEVDNSGDRLGAIKTALDENFKNAEFTFDMSKIREKSKILTSDYLTVQRLLEQHQNNPNNPEYIAARNRLQANQAEMLLMYAEKIDPKLTASINEIDKSLKDGSDLDPARLKEFSALAIGFEKPFDLPGMDDLNLSVLARREEMNNLASTLTPTVSTLEQNNPDFWENKIKI